MEHIQPMQLRSAIGNAVEIAAEVLIFRDTFMQRTKFIFSRGIFI